MKEVKKFEEAFKRRVVLEVVRGEISQEEARRRYRIGGKSTILKWMRSFAGMNPNVSGPNPLFILQGMSKDDDTRKLEEEIARLKAQLQHAELKGRAYQIMVEIAKEKYGIDLEKKSGAKQSPNLKKNSPK